MQSQSRFHGIDFSGGAAGWKQRRARPTVWVSTITSDGRGRFDLADVRAVQDLEGDGRPFDRLVTLLRDGDFEAAAIDAPFSIPDDHLPVGGHRELLSRVREMPDATDRPFPRGLALVDLATARTPLARAKPLRRTECYWQSQGLPVRSTLWNGPRPGAPFTIACLALLARAARPIWPWSSGPGMLVEAYPAAQLKEWGWRPQPYGGSAHREARCGIVGRLREHLRIDPRFEEQLRSSADALDAVIAAFGAAAAAADTHVAHDVGRDEGMIAVERRREDPHPRRG